MPITKDHKEAACEYDINPPYTQPLNAYTQIFNNSASNLAEQTSVIAIDPIKRI